MSFDVFLANVFDALCCFAQEISSLDLTLEVRSCFIHQSHNTDVQLQVQARSQN